MDAKTRVWKIEKNKTFHSLKICPHDFLLIIKKETLIFPNQLLSNLQKSKNCVPKRPEQQFWYGIDPIVRGKKEKVCSGKKEGSLSCALGSQQRSSRPWSWWLTSKRIYILDAITQAHSLLVLGENGNCICEWCTFPLYQVSFPVPTRECQLK